MVRRDTGESNASLRAEPMGHKSELRKVVQRRSPMLVREQRAQRGTKGCGTPDAQDMAAGREVATVAVSEFSAAPAVSNWYRNRYQNRRIFRIRMASSKRAEKARKQR